MSIKGSSVCTVGLHKNEKVIARRDHGLPHAASSMTPSEQLLLCQGTRAFIGTVYIYIYSFTILVRLVPGGNASSGDRNVRPPFSNCLFM